MIKNNAHSNYRLLQIQKRNTNTWRWIYECIWDIVIEKKTFVYKQTNNLNWFILHWKQWTGTSVDSHFIENENENVCQQFIDDGCICFGAWDRVLCFEMHFPCSQSIFPCSTMSKSLECNCDDARFVWIYVCEWNDWACTVHIISIIQNVLYRMNSMWEIFFSCNQTPKKIALSSSFLGPITRRVYENRRDSNHSERHTPTHAYTWLSITDLHARTFSKISLFVFG